MTNIFSCSHFIALLVQHYDTNESLFPGIFPSSFIQNEMRNKITVNDLKSGKKLNAIFTFWLIP